MPEGAPDAPCRLCGGPLAAAQRSSGFCCEGCARVSEILDGSGFRGDRRGSAAFLEAARAGLIRVDQQLAPRVAAAPAATSARQVSFALDGLWCPSCAWLVESVLGSTPGVWSARVTFFADLAEVSFDPLVIGEEEVVLRIEELGYRVKQQRDRPDPVPLVRFGLAALLQMNVMWLSYALYAHRGGAALEGVTRALPWALAALSAPVIFGAGWPTLDRAWRALRARALVMDSLIALAAVSAWLYSVAATARGSTLVYFDGASGLITFRLLGRLLEQAAFRKAGRAGEAVRRLLPRKARRMGEQGPSWAPADALAPGERIRVAPGERVPLDGRVVAGEGRVSTAVVDGEPHPRSVRPGDLVPGGSVCGETALDLVVTAPATASLLSRVADHVARASGRRGPEPEVADSLARLFIPGVLALSAVTFAAWLGHGLAPGLAFQRALTVLVVCCPCALGIAAPLCRVVAAGALARRGIIVRGEGALDRVAEADRIAFDKTGTLTLGRPVLALVEVEGASRGDALAVLAGLEDRAGHPIAHAVREALPAGARPEAVTELAARPGCGVSGRLSGAPVWAGKPAWVESAAGAPPERLGAVIASEQDRGRTAILLAWGEGRWAALRRPPPAGGGADDRRAGRAATRVRGALRRQRASRPGGGPRRRREGRGGGLPARGQDRLAGADGPRARAAPGVRGRRHQRRARPGRLGGRGGRERHRLRPRDGRHPAPRARAGGAARGRARGASHAAHHPTEPGLGGALQRRPHPARRVRAAHAGVGGSGDGEQRADRGAERAAPAGGARGGAPGPARRGRLARGYTLASRLGHARLSWPPCTWAVSSAAAHRDRWVATCSCFRCRCCRSAPRHGWS